VIETVTHTIENTLSLKQTTYGSQSNNKYTGLKRDFLLRTCAFNPLLVMSQIAGTKCKYIKPYLPKNKPDLEKQQGCNELKWLLKWV